MRPNLTRPLTRIPRRNKHPHQRTPPTPYKWGKGGGPGREVNGSSARKNRTSGNSERKRKSCSPPGPGPGDRRGGRPTPGRNQNNRFMRNQTEPDDGSTRGAPGPANAKREGSQGPRGRDPPTRPWRPPAVQRRYTPEKIFSIGEPGRKKQQRTHARARPRDAHTIRAHAQGG